jgi:hypothetical protein
MEDAAKRELVGQVFFFGFAADWQKHADQGG